MKAFVNKGLTRNPETANIPSDFWTKSRDCVQLGIPNFGTIATNEMLLIAAKFQNYNFYCFWVVEGKPTGAKNPHPSDPD